MEHKIVGDDGEPRAQFCLPEELSEGNFGHTQIWNFFDKDTRKAVQKSLKKWEPASSRMIGSRQTSHQCSKKVNVSKPQIIGLSR